MVLSKNSVQSKWVTKELNAALAKEDDLKRKFVLPIKIDECKIPLKIYILYSVGGFLNLSDDSSNINLNGIMTLSFLAGLFADRTTLKLKEVFDVLMKPKEDRPDKLEDTDPKFNNIKADPLEAGVDTVIVLAGNNLDKGTIVVKINDQIIKNITFTKDAATFTYQLPFSLKDKNSVKLTATNGKINFAFDLPIKKS